MSLGFITGAILGATLLTSLLAVPILGLLGFSTVGPVAGECSRHTLAPTVEPYSLFPCRFICGRGPIRDRNRCCW